MNSSYFPLVYSFTSEFIPYLRDENDQRLQRIGEPYGIDAPPEVYNRIIELDARENRREGSVNLMASFGDESMGGEGDDDIPDFQMESEFSRPIF